MYEIKKSDLILEIFLKMIANEFGFTLKQPPDKKKQWVVEANSPGLIEFGIKEEDEFYKVTGPKKKSFVIKKRGVLRFDINSEKGGRIYVEIDKRDKTIGMSFYGKIYILVDFHRKTIDIICK
jgi:hypothetical protein